MTTVSPARSPGGSAENANALVFVNNRGDSSLTSVALKGDSGNVVVNTIPAAEFENAALGDMQFSKEDWIFVNLAAESKVATIDPLTAATPEHKANLPTGTRPVHMYRDRNDGEVIWIMNDGDNAPNTTTPGDDLINCNNPARTGGAVVGGSVTVVHNSHLGPGGSLPTVLGTTCLLADGHKVAAFADNGRVFVSSETAGEIAVLDGTPGLTGAPTLLGRIDLCNSNKETGLPAPATCNPENATGTTPFTPNNAAPHGIRWSKLRQKIYSLQEGYGEIVEIDPNPPYAITNTWSLANTPYTSYGISPDGKYLLLRGQTTAPDPQATKLGVIDLSATTPVIANLTTPELDTALNGTSPGAFKFSPDSKRFYILAGNEATATKKDRLFAFDWTTVAPPALTLLKEIPLLSTGGHSFDVLAQGAKEAKYLAVSNASPANSLTIINATDNQEKQTVSVGTNPGGVMVFESGAASAGNQATN